jgi:hypothetical protein
MSPSAAEHARSGQASDRATATASQGVADPRLAQHLADLRSRLRPICRDWDEAAFEALVLRIAWTKVRWADVEMGR